MTKKIVVAGGTGNLGMRIARALIEKKAEVVVLARKESNQNKLTDLTQLGAKIEFVNQYDVEEIAEACKGSDCVVSVLAGLRDVIIEAQSKLLEGAIAAGVPRIIPSDFSIDYMDLEPGENRNFDLRREFYEKSKKAPIAVTHIFNGAFGEILSYNIPLLDFKNQKVNYWENPDWRMDFTAMDDVASFTSCAALDHDTPLALRIASFQMSPKDLVVFTAENFGKPFELVRQGSLEDLRSYNKRERAAYPQGENELYAKWQQSQYIQSMFSTNHSSHDNDRYPEIKWKKLSDLIRLDK
jgi:nucleoside-diphosphate-sugar epimerase